MRDDVNSKQLEYYFSDENLPTDMFLKKKMQESGNGTVELQEIMDFPRMKRHRRRMDVVIAILKESPFLDITEDNKFISRKIPYIWPDSDIGEDYEEKQAEWQARQKNRPSQGRKKPNIVGMPERLATGMDKPTGFENTFVDGPIRPSEYAEERQTYDPEESVHARLAIAIHRYSVRRKFHENYALIFQAFMKYGGVERRGGEFQGGNIKDDELEDATPAQVAHLKSNYDIGYDKDPDEGIWVLDFEGVAKGFL